MYLPTSANISFVEFATVIKLMASIKRLPSIKRPHVGSLRLNKPPMGVY